MTTPPAPPRGWYPDPNGLPCQREWDGTRWTDNTAPLPTDAPAPMPMPPPLAAPTPSGSFRLAKNPGETGILGPKPPGNQPGVAGTLIGLLAAGGVLFWAYTAIHNSSSPDTTVAPAASVALPTAAAAAPATTAPPLPPADDGKLNDKGWVLQSLDLSSDFDNDWAGTARITNTNDAASTGVFTVTLMLNGSVAGTMEGSADAVSPGQTVTVQFISQDKATTAKVKYTFQTDTSYASS